MTRILVPIDPNEPARTRSAIEQVVRMRRTEQVSVRLLRVQPKVSGHVAMIFAPGELLELQMEAGAEDLQYAQSLLDLAGVSYTSIVLVGRSAETIAMAARDYGCRPHRLRQRRTRPGRKDLRLAGAAGAPAPERERGPAGHQLLKARAGWPALTSAHVRLPPLPYHSDISPSASR